MDKSEQFLDSKGRKVRIKLLVRKKYPMSKDGFAKWNHRSRNNIAKSKFVWRPYASSKSYFYRFFPESNGSIPIEFLQTDRDIGNFILDYLAVDDGDTLAIQGFCHGKTKTHIKFSKHLAVIKIINAENRQFQVSKTQSLSRYWFRRELTKT